MTDTNGLKAIGWAFGATTAAVFLIATMLVGQTVGSSRGTATAGYGTPSAIAGLNQH